MFNHRPRHRDRRGFRTVATTWLRIVVPLLLAAFVLVLAWSLRPGLVTGIPRSPVSLAVIGAGAVVAVALVLVRVVTGSERAAWWAETVPPIVAVAVVLVPLVPVAFGAPGVGEATWVAVRPSAEQPKPPKPTTVAGKLEPAASQTTTGVFAGVVGRRASGAARLVPAGDNKLRLEIRRLTFDLPVGSSAKATVDVLLLPGAGGQQLHRVRLGAARSGVPVQTYPLPADLRLTGPATILLWQPDPGRPIATASLASR